MTGLWIALSFLTRLPMPAVRDGTAGDIARAAPWLPVAGAVIGALVGLAAVLCASAGPWVAALASLVAWVLITGALHLDGLADVADGLGAAHGKPERFLEVARDPNIGSFGAVAIGLQLIAKLVLLAALIERATASEILVSLILVAAWARWTPLAVGWSTPTLAPGLAAKLHAGISLRVVVIEALTLAALSIAIAPALLVAIPVAGALAVYWRARLGGVTGDGHGAGIELQESALLAALAFLL